MTLRLLQCDDGPADMCHDLPVYERFRRHGATRSLVVGDEKVVSFGDAAAGQVLTREAPAFGENPAYIFQRIAESGEFPVEHAGQMPFVHEVIAGAVIAVDERRFLFDRRVEFAPAQSPFEGSVRFRQLIEIVPVMRDVVARVHRFQEGQPRLRRLDVMQQCQVLREFARQPLAVRHQRRFARDAMSARYARQALHDEELSACDGGIAAQEQRLRRVHAGGVGGLQDVEFLAALETRFDARRRIGTQHPVMRPGVTAAAEINVERPVLLHRAAAHARERPDVGRVGAARQAQKRFEAGTRVSGVKIHHQKSKDIEPPINADRRR